MISDAASERSMDSDKPSIIHPTSDQGKTTRNILTMAAVAAVLAAAPARADDGGADAVYERMQASFSVATAEAAPMLEAVYAPGASYLPRHKEAGIDGREAILRGMTGFLDRVRKDGGRIETRFRVVERKRLGDV